jgi:hypothetical protein
MYSGKRRRGEEVRRMRKLIHAVILAVCASVFASTFATAQQDQQQSAPQPSDQPQPSQPPTTAAPAANPEYPGYKQTPKKPSQAPMPAPQVTQPAPVQGTAPPEAPQPTYPNYPPTMKTLQTGKPEKVPIPPPAPMPPTAQPIPPQPNETLTASQVPVLPPYKPSPTVYILDQRGSTFINVDSWMYNALLRLYSLGYLDSAFLDLRPWTRLSVAHMLSRMQDKLAANPQDTEAREIYEVIRKDLEPDVISGGSFKDGYYEFDSAYTRQMGIAGLPLRDSFHVGSTIINDYGRPYAEGFNNITGTSMRIVAGRFTAYYRGEFQHAPAWAGYNSSVTAILANIDQVFLSDAYSTIPVGPVSAVNRMSVIEGYVSGHFLSNEISFGKSDEWMSPAEGGAFAFSNNAQNIYAFRIDRVEPLYIPLLSKLIGPLRYDFEVGPLPGHTYPHDPWMHAEKFAFRPTENFELGFERTVIWGGHTPVYAEPGVYYDVPITIGSFFNGFFDISDTNNSQKYSRNDPGARFSQFDFSYRLPWLRKWLTFYVDSEVHDDVTPPSAPRRSAIRPGLYLSHVPGIPKLDARVEAVSTDPPTHASHAGQFMYYETIQRQGYTNNGQIFGDWIGREAKGGQAWLTYHFNPREWIQVEYRTAKAAKDFIPGGTTQNDYLVQVVKVLPHNFAIDGWVQFERWEAPLLKPGPQHDTTMVFQFAWNPRIRKPALSVATEAPVP